MHTDRHGWDLNHEIGCVPNAASILLPYQRRPRCGMRSQVRPDSRGVVQTNSKPESFRGKSQVGDCSEEGERGPGCTSIEQPGPGGAESRNKAAAGKDDANFVPGRARSESKEFRWVGLTTGGRGRICAEGEE